jgi:hypothetical protein
MSVCPKWKIDDMPLLSENREKPDRKKLGELNYDTDEQTIVECQQSDESHSMFLTLWSLYPNPHLSGGT